MIEYSDSSLDKDLQIKVVYEEPLSTKVNPRTDSLLYFKTLKMGSMVQKPTLTGGNGLSIGFPDVAVSVDSIVAPEA